MRRPFLETCALGAVLLLPACHTIEGAGRDIQVVGDGVSFVARDINNEVFGGYGRWEQGVASAGEPCDRDAGELAGGSSLPRCPR